MRTKKWDQAKLESAVRTSRSIRQVIKKLGLVPAGGNYQQIKHYIKKWRIKTDHFLGRGWNVGLKFISREAIPLKKILTTKSSYQSYKLKRRLFTEGLKKPKCELCGWSIKSKDGRVPLELEHINGNCFDNRLKNLRILCPNCHSLQPSHRALNSKK